MSIKKSMLYKRLFFTYVIVIVFLIAIFDGYLINSMVANEKENRLFLGEKLVYDINEVINEFENSNKYITNTLYYDQTVTKDLINFIEKDINEYLKEKLDKFSQTNEADYRGTEGFIEKSFISNENIESLSLLNMKNGTIRTFNKLNQITEMKVDKNLLKNISPVISIENHISYINDINNPLNLESEGKLVITYKLNKFEEKAKKYGTMYSALILDDLGNTLYDSTGNKVAGENSNWNSIKDISQEENKKISRKNNVFKVTTESKLNIIGQTSLASLIDNPKKFYNSIIILDLILFVAALGILRLKLESFTERTNKLLKAMDEVKEGNLKALVNLNGEEKEIDEISYISEHFNEMCKDLEKHINKSYLAEINQKKAEMVALQNQINPHFLYNTLECIRMKAVCNGDREVGKMLYNLSFLFRKQVKDNNIITLKSELEYCEKYMDIFKFRYHEKFNFEINCKEEFYNNEIIKFTLQPLIENYFVHGIKLDEGDNFIKIEVLKDNDFIKIQIDDNGRGISEEKLREINERLKENSFEESNNKSIGILNAQGRLVGAYGENCGIKLENKKEGARIIVTIPCKGLV